MLIEFRVENHRSLRDEQVLTMEAGRGGDDADARPRRVKGHSERLLPVAVLYGANASGKSNVLDALGFMRDAALGSHQVWPPDGGIPRDPFAWGPKRDEPSFFEVSFILKPTRYQYGFVASDSRFLEEWLYAWPRGKKQAWFVRDGQKFKFGENLKGENKLIQSVTRENALFLSSAAQHRHPRLTEVYAWFASLRTFNMRIHVILPSRSAELITPNLRDAFMYEFGHDLSLRNVFSSEESANAVMERFRSILRNADTGIVDVRLAQSESGDSPRPMTPRVRLKHRSSLDNAWLPLSEESRGTQSLFRLALHMVGTLERGGVLVVDELESSLHPSLAREIVRQFNDPASNPRNAQLIFTTHDTNLLGTTVGEPVLRRDEVWLTEKDDEGATVLYPLTDYKPRKAENLEHGYLQGRYGAIPFLGEFRIGGETAATARG